MDFLLEQNDISDDEEVLRAELPEEYYEELEHYSKLESINKFKNYISKEPEFYGITNISDVDLFIIMSKARENNKMNLNSHLYCVIEDIYETIFGSSSSIFIYNGIVNDILKKCSV